MTMRMKKNLGKILGVGIISGAVIFSGGTYENVYAGGGITGSTTRYSKQKKEWKDESSKNDPRWGKTGRKFLDKINPYSKIIEGAEKFSEKYNKFRERRENKGDKIGIGTGSSTRRFKRK